jgi:drug/metabolite transporter (DMT)-like permease
MSTNWVLFAVSASIMWGIGYTVLVPVSEKIQAYTVYTIYGFFTFVVNLSIIAINGTFDNFKMIDNWKLSLYLSLYVILSIVAAIVFLLGYTVEGINPGIYIIISNSYPVITFVLSYFLLGKTDINPYYASFGIVLTFIGCGFLAFAKN